MSHSLQAPSSPLVSSSSPIPHQGSTLPPPRLLSSNDVKVSLDRHPSHCTNTQSNLFREDLLSLDEMNVDPKEDKHNYVFAQHTVDMVYSSYAAAKSRLRLYAHLTNILQQEVDEWAQKVERVGVIIPGYKPVGWLELAASGSAW